MRDGQLHILLVSSWYPNEYQPFLGNFVKRQAELIAQFHKVSVIHTVSDRSETGMRLETVSSGNLTEHFIYHKRGKSILAKQALQKKTMKLGLKQLKKVDLMISHVMLPKGIQFTAMHKQLNCPWIHVEHGSYFREEIWHHLSVFQKTIIHRTAKRFDHLYVVSEALKKDLAERLPGISIDILPNHIDTARFSLKAKSPSAKKQFLHISTLDPSSKNPWGMFDACSVLKAKGIENFHFTVVCDETTHEWKDYCEELEISELVTFKGPLSYEEIPAEYHKADVFVLNSEYESFSIVTAEAWATGTPVISTPVGIAENLPTELGIQTRIGITASIVSAMEMIIDEEVTFDQQKIREAALEFSEEHVGALLQDIIRRHVQ